MLLMKEENRGRIMVIKQRNVDAEFTWSADIT